MSIRVENLSHIYMAKTPYEKLALDNISVEIGDREFTGIIGHTGSGKSTLVQHFNGLLKPTSGRIFYDGEDISKANLRELRRNIGMVFQYPEHQLFDETVYKDISFGLTKQGLKEDEIRERINEAAAVLEIGEDLLQKSPFDLSGGQKRRVAIAGVIVMRPKVLILDEPAAGLDPRGRDKIYGLIRNMYKSAGITVILVSHNMEDIARLVDRVIVMNRGGIEMDGDVESIFRNVERLEEIGLTAPQITYFMKRLKESYPGINDNVFTVESAKKEIEKLMAGKGTEC
jgi:energy-coupling factor transport system ATP-binding protein